MLIAENKAFRNEEEDPTEEVLLEPREVDEDLPDTSRDMYHAENDDEGIP